MDIPNYKKLLKANRPMNWWQRLWHRHKWVYGNPRPFEKGYYLAGVATVISTGRVYTQKYCPICKITKERLEGKKWVKKEKL